MMLQNAGTYILILKLSQEKSIYIGRLGLMHFSPGYYFYVGSALKNFSQRISRHIKKDKKLHWHIDYLTTCDDFLKISVLEIFSPERLECRLAGIIANINYSYATPILNFGASDCKSCSSHLFHFGLNTNLNQLLDSIKIKIREELNTTSTLLGL